MFRSLPKQRKYSAFYFLKLFPPLVNIIFPCVLLCFLINLFPFLCIFFSYSDSGIYNNYTALKCAIDKGLNHCSGLLHAICFLILVWIYLIIATFNSSGCNLRLQTLGYVDCCYQLINGRPVMLKWHFLMFSGFFFFSFFFLSFFLDPVQNVVQILEKQYLEEKRSALEEQRVMYERELELLRQQLSPERQHQHGSDRLSYTAQAAQQKVNLWTEER